MIYKWSVAVHCAKWKGGQGILPRGLCCGLKDEEKSAS